MSRKKQGEVAQTAEVGSTPREETSATKAGDAPGQGVIQGDGSVAYVNGTPLLPGTPIGDTGKQTGAGATATSNGKPKLTRRERFVKYAPKRVQSVLDAMRRLRACSNRSGYEFTDEEIARIVKAIKAGVDLLEGAFATKTVKREVFTL